MVVIKRLERRAKSGDSYWLCRCDCGIDTEVAGSHLRTSNGTRSCKRCSKPSRTKDLAGIRVGRLQVICGCGKDKQGRALWKCICDCGSEAIVPSRHLIQHNVVSCGCYRNEKSRENGKVGGIKISGPKSHLYKPELSDEERLAERNLVETRKWRSAVFERDNYTCRVCGRQGGKLQAHHLFSWAGHKELRFDINNGLTVCAEEHRAFHLYNGGPRKSCTASDFDRFVEHGKKVQNASEPNHPQD